jgi:flavin-dependent dehydrogenase
VVGAGPAGAAVALFLARQGRQVVVVERQCLPGDKPCGEGHMPAGVEVLRELDVLQPLLDQGAPWIAGARFSAPAAASVAARFPRGPGLGVRRTLLNQVLAERMKAQPRISVHEGCAAMGITFGAPLELSTSHGAPRVKAVVAADGLRSPLRKSLGWTAPVAPPHRYGIVGHLCTDDRPEPFISVDVRNGYEIFSAPSGQHEQLVAVLGSKHLFAGRSIEAAFRGAIGREAELSTAPVVIGPFNMRPRQLAGGGAFLLGDAAGFLDPITGQGLEMALLSARYLASVLGHMLDGHLTGEQAADVYRRHHQRAWRDLHRLTRLVLWLTASPRRTARGMRGLELRPEVLDILLGINCGYWGFSKLTPRDWLTLLMGSACP